MWRNMIVDYKLEVSEDINKSIEIYDNLFIYRGLDEEDLKNYFLVAEYIKLTQK